MQDFIKIRKQPKITISAIVQPPAPKIEINPQAKSAMETAFSATTNSRRAVSIPALCRPAGVISALGASSGVTGIFVALSVM